jgi:hypothetical protein
MNESIQRFEQAALAAYGRGETWSAFWKQHAEQVKQAEPYNARRLKRLVDHLLHLLTTGETSGQYPPVIAEPWERDNQDQHQLADIAGSIVGSASARVRVLPGRAGSGFPGPRAGTFYAY